MAKGLTSKEFIRNLEKRKEFGDEQILGLPQEEFKEIVKEHETISSFTEGLKESGVTEFGTGWGTRMLMEAVKMKQFGEILKLTKVAGGLFGKEPDFPVAPTPSKDMEVA